jgi:hypothetical protein
MVIPLLVSRRVLDADQGARVAEAMGQIFQAENASPFEQREFETLRAAFGQMVEIKGTD